MEKRAILAAVLMAALLIVYQTFFLPTPSAPPPDQQAQAPKTPAPGPAPTPAPTAQAPAPPAPGPAAPPAAPAKPVERPAQRIVPVASPLYRAQVSSEGGKLLEWTLDYRGPKPMVVVGELGPVGLLVGREDGALQPIAMTPEQPSLNLSREMPTGAVAFRGAVDGLTVREALRFNAETYAMEIAVRIENTTGSAVPVTVALPWQSSMSWGTEPEKFLGERPVEVVWSISGSVDRAPHAMNPLLEYIAEAPKLGRPGDWIALGSIWYVAALVPKTPGFELTASIAKPTPAKNGTAASRGHVTIGVQARPTIAPGQAWEGAVLVYIGPKEYDRLRALGLQETINFGGFLLPWYYGGPPMSWLGVPILLAMNWLYGVVGNYGIAIIFLTVVSKVLFYPLTVKGMRSMKAMQSLQPQINALRNKYKADPQRVQRETLELYRKHKVNPAGGCLPMIAQVPIFYALYLALSASVELQGATFGCIGRAPSWALWFGGKNVWVCDLADYDPTYVWPILMGVTMFVQQKMTPVAGDPRQAKMMLLMPFVFTFMFLNLPSGLVLYWTVSNILQILQQWYMDRPGKAKREGGRETAKEAGRA